MNIKCYLCGWTNAHALGCPNKYRNKPAPNYLLPTPTPTPTLDDVKKTLESKKDIDIATPEAIDGKTGLPKVGNTVIGVVSNELLGTNQTCIYTVQPLVICRIRSLWIADECADEMDIEDVRIGNRSLIPDVPVHASHFSMKYRDKYPAVDFNETCTPAHRIMLVMKNRGYLRFVRALFEVTTLRDASPLMIAGWDDPIT